MPVKVCAIVAMAENRVIGRGQEIPWKLPEDMRRFAALTTGHTVLMGRKTFESLPERFRPLPGRANVVATRDSAALSSHGEGVQTCTSPQGYLELAKAGGLDLRSDLIWIAGGSEIYRLTSGYWDELFLTLVEGAFEGDVVFPEFEGQFQLSSSEPHAGFCFKHYVRL